MVVALPPPLAGRIVYDPLLPGYRDQLTQRTPMGTVVKAMAVYDEPFWRADGLSGQATTDEGMVRLTYDNSPPDGSPGVLLGFVEGARAREFGLLDAAERRRVVVDTFARLFGPRAAEPERYIERLWAEEEYTRGCYGAHMPTGAWTAYGPALREPIGPIHWACTEAALIWNGYMDGAVRSGESAGARGGWVRACDAVVIGAGHNGLTAAAYLARAGLSVEVLERRDIAGGACVTEELWPGRAGLAGRVHAVAAAARDRARPRPGRPRPPGVGARAIPVRAVPRRPQGGHLVHRASARTRSWSATGRAPTPTATRCSPSAGSGRPRGRGR